MTTPIWVQSVTGNDANDGSSYANRVKTIAQAMSLITVGAPGSGTYSVQIYILDGTYSDAGLLASLPSLPGITELNLTLSGIDHVVIQSSDGSAPFFGLTTLPGLGEYTLNLRVEDLIFKDYPSVFSLTFGDVGPGQDVNIFTENCTYAKELLSGTFKVVDINYTGTNTPPAPNFGRFTYYAQNNTVYHMDSVYSVESSVPTLTGNSRVGLTVGWERNNIYDITDRSLSVVSEQNSACHIEKSNSPNILIDYNAVPLADVLGAHDIILVAPPGSNSNSPIYINGLTAPYDLSIQRANDGYLVAGNSTIIPNGEFGVVIGSTFWPVAKQVNGTIVNLHSESNADSSTLSSAFGSPTDWTNSVASGQNGFGASSPLNRLWINDTIFFDPASPLTREEADASPAVLTTDNDPRWVIDVNNLDGGAKSARVKTHWIDMGTRVFYRSFDFYGQQNPSLPGSQKEYLQASTNTSARQFEVRATNDSTFASNDDLPTSSLAFEGAAHTQNDISTYGRSNGPFRYWQFRVTLRADVSF